MMKSALFKLKSRTTRQVPTVAAALLLALSTGCANNAGREAGAASASKAVAASTPARRVQVSVDGAEPSVATAEDGTVYVAWVAHRPNKEADVWLSRFDVEGKPTGTAVRVNPTNGEATAWRGDPPDVAVAPDGAVYILWTANDAGAAHATTLFLSASRDGGRSFGRPVRVNDDARACQHGMHSLALGRDGRVHVAWLDERDLPPPETMQMSEESGAAKASAGMHGEANRAVYFASSSDGGQTFSRNVRLATEACPCCKTSLAVSTDGRVYVGWRQVLPGDFRHIAVAASADGGATFNAPTVVSDDRWELRACPVSGPALAAGEGGAVHVLWYTAGAAGQPGLYSAESADGGRTFSQRSSVKEGNLRGAPLLLVDGRGRSFAVYEGMGENGSNGLWRSRLGEATGGATSVVMGEAASAATRGERLNVAYVTQGGVWLAQTDLTN